MSVSPLPGRHGEPSFDDFYREYFPRVVMLVARHFPGCDPEDIAQETMTRCYTNFAELDPDREPWGWVSMVARNAAIDVLRRTSRVVPTAELPEPPGEAADTTYDAVLVGERRRSVRSALAQLRPADRQLIEDHELEGIGYADLAVIRDMTPNALRQQLFRARNRLAAELRRLGAAALGTVPVSLQARFARVARRVDDAASAAGPAAATALGIAAVAGVATVGSLLVGPSGPPTVSAAAGTRPAAGDPVPAVERGARAGGARPVDQPAGVRPGTTRPTRSGTGTGAEEPADPVLPVRIRNDGDPVNNPKEPSRQGVYVDTPVGEFFVETGGESTPPYGLLCNLGLKEYCPSE